jgi:hypothetical protein
MNLKKILILATTASLISISIPTTVSAGEHKEHKSHSETQEQESQIASGIHFVSYKWHGEETYDEEGYMYFSDEEGEYVSSSSVSFTSHDRLTKSDLTKLLALSKSDDEYAVEYVNLDNIFSYSSDEKWDEIYDEIPNEIPSDVTITVYLKNGIIDSYEVNVEDNYDPDKEELDDAEDEEIETTDSDEEITNNKDAKKPEDDVDITEPIEEEDDEDLNTTEEVSKNNEASVTNSDEADTSTDSITEGF